MFAATAVGLGSAASAAGKASGTVNVVVYPQGSWSENYNPFSPSQLWGTDGMIYEPLLQYIQLTGKAVPWLATSYHWSNGDKTLTMQLRSGVDWNNGTPFTSSDVVFTFDLLKKFPGLDTGAVWSFLSGVKAAGPHTVVFTLKSPDISGLYYIASVTPVPESVWSKIKNPVTYINPKPVATGPFMNKSFSPQEYILGRNPHYWQKGRPYVSALAFPAYTSNTSVDIALAKGQIDWAALFAPNIQKTYVAPDPKQHHYFFPQGAPVVVYLNNKDYPLNNPKVRQALSMAINRSQVSKIGEYGYEQPANALGIPPLQKSYVDPAVTKQAAALSTYNPSGAVAMLKKLGFHRNAQGVMMTPKGKPFTLGLNVVSSYTDWVQDTQQIASQLGKIGIKVTVHPLQYAAYYSDMQHGTFQASIGWSSSGPNPFYFFNFTMNPRFSAAIGQVASTNFDRFNSAVADRYLHTYNTTSNGAVQKAALGKVEQVWLQEMPAIPLVWGAYWNEYSTQNFVGWPTASNMYTDPGPNDMAAELTALRIHPK
jgi:peptide/nickel transport system substrate-binding protein